MESEPRNRMKNKGGRPTLAEAAERMKTPPPEVIKEPEQPPKLQCSRCGCMYLPRVSRTVGEVRYMQCNRCGYSHRIPPDLLAKIISR